MQPVSPSGTNAMIEVEGPSGRVRWNVQRASDSARYVAICEPLALTVEGDTYAEVLMTVRDTMNLMFRSLAKQGKAG